MGSTQLKPRVSYLTFQIVLDATRKTGRWLVYGHNDGPLLGEVKWFGRWRKYCFFPAPDTVFDRSCLDHIGDFIDEKMRMRAVGK